MAVNLDAPRANSIQAPATTLDTAAQHRWTLRPVRRKPAFRHWLVPVAKTKEPICPISSLTQAILEPRQPRTIRGQRLQPQHARSRPSPQRLNSVVPAGGRQILQALGRTNRAIQAAVVVAERLQGRSRLRLHQGQVNRLVGRCPSQQPPPMAVRRPLEAMRKKVGEPSLGFKYFTSHPAP